MAITSAIWRTRRRRLWILTPPEDSGGGYMGVDYDGNFVCSGGMRTLPVWTDVRTRAVPAGRDDAAAAANQVSRSISRLSRSSLRSNNPKKKSDGVCGWIGRDVRRQLITVIVPGGAVLTGLHRYDSISVRRRRKQGSTSPSGKSPINNIFSLIYLTLPFIWLFLKP